jgi:hypothetical protein
LQLDWLSSSDSDDTDDDSGIEVVSVQYKQSAQRVSCISIGEIRSAYRNFVLKSEGKRTLSRDRWEGSVKIDLKEIDCWCMN